MIIKNILSEIAIGLMGKNLEILSFSDTKILLEENGFTCGNNINSHFVIVDINDLHEIKNSLSNYYLVDDFGTEITYFDISQLCPETGGDE